ncbi:MAG: hypothetical protein VYA32_11215 [Planctomycetota bacterium]|nr:hypothetical protein [Planctomycetota bacterium]
MNPSRRGTICCVVGVVALAVAVWGWTENRSASFSVTGIVVLAIAGVAWRRPKWASGGGGYRILLAVALPAVILASRESIDRGLAKPGEVYLRGQVNYADVMINLYPERDGYRFLKGQQLGLCRDLSFVRDSLQRDVFAARCRKMAPATLARVRRELERAIATGVTSNEDLLRIYSGVLEEGGADPAEIEQARQALFRHHPRLRPVTIGRKYR